MRRSTAVITFLVFALVSVSTLQAGVPLQLNHQGILTDAMGSPVNGAHTLTFHIFESPVGGAPLWSEVHAGVMMTEGLFNVTLGSITPLASDVLAPSGSGLSPDAIERFLEVQVDADPPLLPRTRLIAVPFAVASGRLAGDIETGPGSFTTKSSNGNFLQGAVDVLQAEISLGSEDFDRVDSLVMRGRKSKTYVKMSDQDIASAAQRTLELSADSAGSSLVVDGDDNGDGVIERRLSATNQVSQVKVRGWDHRMTHNVDFEFGSTDSSAGVDIHFDAGDVERKLIGKTERKSGSVILTDRMGQEVMRSGFLNDSSGASSFLDADADGDGFAESSTSLRATKTGSTMSGDFKYEEKGHRFSFVSDSTGANGLLDTDADGDGVVERRYQTLSNASSARSRWLADLDDDGSPDYTATQSADAAGARLAIKTKGTSAHRFGTTVGASADSSVIENTFDENGDGAPEYRMSHAVVVKKVTVRLASDPDEDGDAESSVTQLSDDSSGSVTVVSRFGSGPRQTTSMDGTYSSASHRCATDIDDDGAPEYSTENYTDSSNARGVFASESAHVRARVAASTASSEVGTDTDHDGVDDYAVILSSNTLTSEINITEDGVATLRATSAGDLFANGSVGVGVVPGSHRIDVDGGAYCDGTNWVNASDANSKENFEGVDGAEVLKRLADLEITRWNYKGQTDVTHIGPTAQDFQRAFGVGSDNKSISTIDPSGIALAAIQELHKQNQELRGENRSLQEQLNDLKEAVEVLQKRQ